MGDGWAMIGFGGFGLRESESVASEPKHIYIEKKKMEFDQNRSSSVFG